MKVETEIIVAEGAEREELVKNFKFVTFKDVEVGEVFWLDGKHFLKCSESLFLNVETWEEPEPNEYYIVCERESLIGIDKAKLIVKY